MQSSSASGSENGVADAPRGGVAAPAIALPKGGGAVGGMGEKFATNAVTGTGSMSVPIAATPGRSGFGPGLSIGYDSGAANGAFGFGWHLSLPRISRKTDKGLPRYRDAQDGDTFLLTDAEDLVPTLVHGAGGWVREVLPPRSVYGNRYAIHRYRPRVEGLFARIERWVDMASPADTFWRTITRDNVTTWYGRTAQSRIADPGDPGRVFSWLICESSDDKGNAVFYDYKAEDSAGVDLAQVQERNRSALTRSAQRYVKRVRYGNRVPYLPDLDAAVAMPAPVDWCFELVFDYGEHDLQAPLPQETQPWTCRPDPFSNYRAGFELRTYRLCRRALMFHHFADAPGVGLDCLVRSTDLQHASAAPADASQPVYSHLLSVTQVGYVRKPAGGYLAGALPPLEFEYTQATIDETVRDVDAESLRNLPAGLGDGAWRWVDLDGEGAPGILSEQGGSWYYKSNLSPANQHGEAGSELTLPRFGALRRVGRQPSPASLNDPRVHLMDLSGDGHLDVVTLDSADPGCFERTDDAGWSRFKRFRAMPVVDWNSPNLRLVDLTGDGLPDLLVGEDDAFLWHPSLSTDGFAPAQRTAQARDQEDGPQLVFSDGTESIFLADMSGDGLTDLVRIRNGEVAYWPNLGYGRFGAKVTMRGSPRFDRADLFDGRRIRLADIDGSGAVDIVYLGGHAVDLYFNQSGNGWGEARRLAHFPGIDSVSSVAVLDLLGTGVACLAWSSALPGQAARPMRYIDLMGGNKPNLLVRSRDNLGTETVARYVPSTRFYVADKLAGTPWITRLPFPVQVVERVETYDHVSRNRFVTRFAYHHGYYDGVEREFRGFGRVDQWDTEEIGALTAGGDFPPPANEDPVSAVPPVCTKTWFHTGAFVDGAPVSRQLAHEYWAEGDGGPAMLDDTALPVDVLLADGSRQPGGLTPGELREACRALRGATLRQEVYGLDGSPAAGRPYSASERNYTIEMLQPQGGNPYGVFFMHGRETLDCRYERKLYTALDGVLVDPDAPPPGAKTVADPRIAHVLTLAVDPFGNTLRSAVVAYGRRYADPALEPADQARQAALHCACTEFAFTNAVLGGDAYRTPLAAQSSSYELVNLPPAAAPSGRFGWAELDAAILAAGDGAHDLAFEDASPAGLEAGQPYRRLIACTRSRYRPNDLGAAAADAGALLPPGVLESLALAGEQYRLAFTPGLLAQVYQRGGAALLPDPAQVLGRAAADGGGYVDLDGDGHWWLPAGRLFHAPAAGSPAIEKAEAQQHFYLPRRVVDPFGHASVVEYDAQDLLVLRTVDAVGNSVAAEHDYRVLAPVLVTDANGNRSAAAFDALGLVAGTAVMGKVGETLGDSLAGFVADLDPALIDDFYAADDPRASAIGLLGTATTRIVHDPLRFYRSRLAAPDDPGRWAPVFAARIARETHVADLAPGQATKTQIEFGYTDGAGRVVQKKAQAEAGPVVAGGPVVDPRWVGSGWTIFNNKGKPVRQYEPFFSPLAAKGHQFEFGVQAGVSPILCYDPLTRVVATLHPNHSYEKVVLDPWRQESWDANDTVLQADPAADPDVGDLLGLLPAADVVPTWHAQRVGGDLGPQEQGAAIKAAAHANTPAVGCLDALGRAFLTVADNGAAGRYATHVEFDIQGRRRSVTDALGRQVVAFDYNLLGGRIHLASMESGERWTLDDVLGKALRAWDSRGHVRRTEYDALRRPTGLFVHGTDPAGSDARTLAGEVLIQKTVYGEGQPDDQGLNLRTRVFQVSDTAGVLTSLARNPATQADEAYDFKGNLLRASRRFVDDYKILPDWSAPPALAQTFVSSLRYDALDRPLETTTPDGSVTRRTYNAANLLETLGVDLRGAGASTPFVTNVDYDALGRRTLIEFGNGAATTSDFDPLTLRLARLVTRRNPAAFPQDCPQSPPADWPGCQVQNLSYAYDAAGNVTGIRDDAQQTIYFRNQRVEPSSDFTYDAVYRLIRATGREQLGLASDGNARAPAPGSYDDAARIGLQTPANGQAMGTYTEQYDYDAVGNFLQFIHRGSQPVNPGWTRSYDYADAIAQQPGKFSNRLGSTTIGAITETYGYDAHGNLLRMPQLQMMQWNFKDELQVSRRQAVNADDGDGLVHGAERTYYVYDGGGQRIRKITESAAGLKTKERAYLGGFEIHREFDSGGNVTLERESLQVTEDRQRVALVETRTAGTEDSPAQSVRYQFGNHVGSAALELDDAAQVISYEEYFPYGNTSFQAGRSAIEVSRKRYRYAGMERDEESGLNYHGARYYASWLGRWVSCDPIGIGDGLNLYLMAKANPVGQVDRSGMDNSETTVVTPRVRADLDAAKIDYVEQVVFDLLDANGAVVTPGRFDIVFRDPRPEAGGRLIIPELKGKNIHALHTNQFKYLEELEEKGGTIRIRSTKVSKLNIAKGQSIKLSPNDFFRVGTENLEDFSKALREIAGGKPITNVWVGSDGEIKLFTSEAEAHEFFKSKGLTPSKPGAKAKRSSSSSSSSNTTASTDSSSGTGAVEREVGTGAKVVKAVESALPTARTIVKNESRALRFLEVAGKAGSVTLKAAKFAGEVGILIDVGKRAYIAGGYVADGEYGKALDQVALLLWDQVEWMTFVIPDHEKTFNPVFEIEVDHDNSYPTGAQWGDPTTN